MAPQSVDDDGLSIVLSPVQVAAILQGASLSANETFMGRLWNRAFGGLELIGGAFELVGAGGLAVTPEPTMLTKAGAAILTLNGIDNFGTGAVQLWTGLPRDTLTAQTAQAAARAMGLSPSTSRTGGIVVDIAVPLAVALGLGALRIAAIRAGRISLAEEEAAGGHTLARHVGKDEAYLRQRLLNLPKLNAASSFTNLDQAEKLISDAIKVRRAEIKTWLQQPYTPASRTFVIKYTPNQTVGITVIRKTGRLENAAHLKIVLQKTLVGKKLYFVLTAFPEI